MTRLILFFVHAIFLGSAEPFYPKKNLWQPGQFDGENTNPTLTSTLNKWSDWAVKSHLQVQLGMGMVKMRRFSIPPSGPPVFMAYKEEGRSNHHSSKPRGWAFLPWVISSYQLTDFCRKLALVVLSAILVASIVSLPPVWNSLVIIFLLMAFYVAYFVVLIWRTKLDGTLSISQESNWYFLPVYLHFAVNILLYLHLSQIIQEIFSNLLAS